MEKIQRSGVTIEIVAALTTALEVGELAPGTRLTEEALAREFGASRVPVREAMTSLVARGLLERRDGGTFVPMLGYHDLEEIYLARGRLEALLLERAAPNISDRTVTKLRTLTKSLEREGNNRRAKRWGEYNREFHFSIMRHAELPVILDIVRDLWDRTEYYRAFYSLSPMHRSTIVGEHEEIIEACVAHDAPRLIQLHDEHRQWLLDGHFPWMNRDEESDSTTAQVK
jgi:DNA-binding GntR family transcriptional regulator